MEIGPVPRLQSVPAVRSTPGDPRLSAVFNIEHSSEPNDDTYSGSGNAASGGQDDEDETDAIVETDQPRQTESRDQTASTIDLIA